MMMMMMMLQGSLCVLLLMLSFSLSGAKSVTESGDVQENSDAQEVRERRDSVLLDLRLHQPSDQSDQNLAALRKLLEEQRMLDQVAFGAALGPNGNRGPYSSHITVVYPVVYANVGNAYDPKTGIFTAPVNGVYYFSFSGHSFSSRPMGLGLFKNGKQMVIVVNHPAGKRYETATNSMNLVLLKGDKVYMELHSTTWIFDNKNHHSTFTGHLLFRL